MTETYQARRISAELRRFLVKEGVNFRHCKFKTEILNEYFTFQINFKLFKGKDYLGTYFSLSLEGDDVSLLEYHPKISVVGRDDHIHNTRAIEEIGNDIYLCCVKHQKDISDIIINNLKY